LEKVVFRCEDFRGIPYVYFFLTHAHTHETTPEEEDHLNRPLSLPPLFTHTNTHARTHTSTNTHSISLFVFSPSLFFFIFTLYLNARRFVFLRISFSLLKYFNDLLGTLYASLILSLFFISLWVVLVFVCLYLCISISFHPF
jgi:hypothetical protein